MEGRRRGGLADEWFPRTVLTLWRNKLRSSAAPERISDAVRAAAAEAAALRGRTRRTVDSTLLDDAVATHDNVNQLCSAIRRTRRVNNPTRLACSSLSSHPRTCVEDR